MIAAGNLNPVELPQRESRIVIIHLHCIGGMPMTIIKLRRGRLVFA